MHVLSTYLLCYFALLKFSEFLEYIKLCLTIEMAGETFCSCYLLTTLPHMMHTLINCYILIIIVILLSDLIILMFKSYIKFFFLTELGIVFGDQDGFFLAVWEF